MNKSQAKKNKNNHQTALPQQKLWELNDNSIWLASTISLFRNIEKFKFPVKLEDDRQKQIISIVANNLMNSPHLQTPKLCYAEDLPPLHKEFLVEHFFGQTGYQQAHAGEAFILDDTGQFLATLNIHDHIQLHYLDLHGELESSWNQLVNLETSLGKAITYAFSPKYGFLTSNFTQCGTALIVTTFLQVPALIHSGKVNDVLDRLADDSLVISGIQGNPNEIIGDILMVQNNYTLGITEENTLSILRAFSTKILVEENSLRSKIAQEESAEIKDRVSRAFGILIHSYQIEAIEALNAISLLKLGVELGWLTGITTREINKLFLNCRRAHLLQHCGEQLKQEEIPHKRAEFIHHMLKNVKSTI